MRAPCRRRRRKNPKPGRQVPPPTTLLRFARFVLWLEQTVLKTLKMTERVSFTEANAIRRKFHWHGVQSRIGKQPNCGVSIVFNEFTLRSTVASLFSVCNSASRLAFRLTKRHHSATRDNSAAHRPVAHRSLLFHATKLQLEDSPLHKRLSTISITRNAMSGRIPSRQSENIEPRGHVSGQSVRNPHDGTTSQAGLFSQNGVNE